jgi:hypothetical protein
MAFDDDEVWGAGGEDPGPSAPHLEDLTWRALAGPDARREWWNGLWYRVCELRLRYQLPVRTRWWEDEIQVEALAALARWVHLYDSGEWQDPPGKLALLFELERVETLLRDGNDPFHPHRDRAEFERHLELLG